MSGKIQGDQLIREFFQEMKESDQKHSAPSFEEMVAGRRRSYRVWPISLAASVAMLIAVSWLFLIQKSDLPAETSATDITIILGGESEVEVSEDQYEWPGIDSWSSETDILLSGI